VTHPNVMAESWATLTSYRLHDLLMFSADVYFRLFETVNRQWWPAPLVGVGLAWVVWVATWQRKVMFVVPVLMAGAWAAVALLYFRDGFSDIHWLGPWWMGAFMLQSLLWLVWCATAHSVIAQDGPVRSAGLLLLMVVSVWPLLSVAMQRPIWQAEVAGLAPDATVLLSLGLLLALKPTRRWAAALLILPLAWCGFSGATLWAMTEPLALALPLVGVAAALVLLIRRR